jgi:Neurotransmitter-gated ion-channel ligand binding domain
MLPQAGRESYIVRMFNSGIAIVRRMVRWNAPVILLCFLLSSAASAAAGPSPAPTPGPMNPPMVEGKPVKVKVGIFVTNLIEVDEVREKFHISGYLAMTWKDPRLVFNSDTPSQQRSYDPDAIWVPRVFLINAVARREKISINIRGDSDGTIHYVELFQAELTTSYFLEAFPFDNESLEIYVQPFLDERGTMSISYDQSTSGVGTEPFVELAQWQILGLSAVEVQSPIADTGKTISELEIDLLVQRRYRYYLWKVFFPLLAMVAIAYSAFWIRITDYYTQISITLTAILTEIAFLFAISTSLPKVPYLTFIDAFFLISFVFSCSSMIELIAVHQALERGFQTGGERMRRLSKYFGPLVYFGLIGLSALVFFVGSPRR